MHPVFGKTCNKKKQIWIWKYTVVKLKKLFYNSSQLLIFSRRHKGSIKEWRFFYDTLQISLLLKHQQSSWMWIGCETPLMNFLLSVSRIVFSMIGCTHMRSSVVLCCYCFISFLTSCVPNKIQYPSLSYFSKSPLN